MSRPSYRIWLVDIHPVIHLGVKHAFSQTEDLLLESSYYSVSEAMIGLEGSYPDLAIIDLQSPDGDGLDLVKRFAQNSPAIPVLVFSAMDEELYGERVLRVGGKGFLEKTASLNVLIDALRMIIDGKVYLSEAMQQRLSRLLSGPIGNDDPLSTLSDREIQVFQLIGQGKSTRQIATHLRRSIKTVETYRDRLRKKLGVESGVELTHLAIQRANRKA